MRRPLQRQPGLLIAVLLAIALIGACSTRPPTNGTGTGTTHYLLTEQRMASEPTGGERLLRVRRIELARFLAVEGIVMQTSEIAVRAARNHLWAEDLSTQLHRDLSRRLAEQLDDVRILAPDQQLRAPAREIMELSVTIDRFQGRFDGYAVVGGEWQLLDSEGAIRAGERFQREQVLSDDGYPALVQSLKEAWTAVVADIANDLGGAWDDEARAE